MAFVTNMRYASTCRKESWLWKGVKGADFTKTSGQGGGVEEACGVHIPRQLHIVESWTHGCSFRSTHLNPTMSRPAIKNNPFEWRELNLVDPINMFGDSYGLRSCAHLKWKIKNPWEGMASMDHHPRTRWKKICNIINIRGNKKIFNMIIWKHWWSNSARMYWPMCQMHATADLPFGVQC